MTTAYLPPRLPDPQRVVLLPGETVEERLEKQRKAERQTILQARKARRQKAQRRRGGERL
jgi:hypothetical protein